MMEEDKESHATLSGMSISSNSCTDMQVSGNSLLYSGRSILSFVLFTATAAEHFLLFFLEMKLFAVFGIQLKDSNSTNAEIYVLPHPGNLYFAFGEVLTPFIGAFLSMIIGCANVITGSFVLSFATVVAMAIIDVYFNQQQPGIHFFLGCVQGLRIPAIFLFYASWAQPNERCILLTFARTGGILGESVFRPRQRENGALVSLFIIWITMIVLWMVCATSLPSKKRNVNEKEFRFLRESNFLKTPVYFPLPWRTILKSKPVIAMAVSSIGRSAATVGFFAMFSLSTDNHSQVYLQSRIFLQIKLASAIVFAALNDLMAKHRYNMTLVRKVFVCVSQLLYAVFVLAYGFELKTRLSYAVMFPLFVIMGLEFASGVVYNPMDLNPSMSGFLAAVSMTSSGVVDIFFLLLIFYFLQGNRQDLYILSFLSATFLFVGGIVFLLFGSGKLQEWKVGGQKHRRSSCDMIFGFTDSEISDEDTGSSASQMTFPIRRNLEK